MRLLAVLILLLFFMILILIARPAGGDSLGDTFRDLTVALGVTEEPTEQLSLVGDIFLGRDVETKMKLWGTDYPFSGDPVGSGEQRVANFEASVPINHIQTPSYTFTFSVDQTFLPALRTAGYRYVSLANNHSLDRGWKGLSETVDALSSAEIGSFGVPNGTRSQVIELSPKHLVGISGFNDITGTVTLSDIEEAIAEINESSSYQIAYVHWGEEYQLEHNVRQKELAQQFIDAGYDAVVGHHPHVVQDIGWYKDSPIFYSLGNYIFDQYFDPSVRVGLRLTLDLADEAVVFNLVPVDSTETYIQPQPMVATEKETFLSALAARSQLQLKEQVLSGQITQQIP